MNAFSGTDAREQREHDDGQDDRGRQRLHRDEEERDAERQEHGGEQGAAPRVRRPPVAGHDVQLAQDADDARSASAMTKPFEKPA